ncbi:MAG: S9 family peptidase [Bacteroidota bacterium]
MKVKTSLFLTGIVLNMSTIIAQSEPKAPKHDTVLVKHKHERIDPYFWMNRRDSREVLDYIHAENAYSEAYFKRLNALQETLLQEFDRRIDPNEESTPYFIQGREFQSKNSAGKDYRDIYVKAEGKQVLFFSENERAKGQSFYELADWAPSPDNNMLAFSEDYVGRRKYTIFFRDEKTRKILKEQIKETDGSLIWANDNKTVFYVKKDPETLREFQVFRHVLGTDPKKDQLVFEEKDERFSVGISKSLTRKYIIITSESSTTNEQLLINANHPELAYEVFLPRKTGHLYEVDDHGNGFYVTSNENSPNNQILFYKDWPSKAPQPEIVVAHDPKVLISDKLTLKDYLVLETRINGLEQIQVIDLKSGRKSSIALKEETYTLKLGYNDEFEAPFIYYQYNSMTTPTTVFKYHFATESSEAFFMKKPIDPAFSPDLYESRRVWATANDGSLIPISIVYRKGTDLSKAPLLLYGYGSYGVNIPATFSYTRLSLLDRGFVYALAHIRGGKYMGETWYENGKFLKKKNTFTDFINCAEYLGMKKYCDPDKIYAQGGSAGGLLMGAVTNMAPYLWKGVIAQVPFVDVVSTMLDESIPLTVGEYEEWGNPNDEIYFNYMLSYSPFDNVRKMNYPAMLITTGYHDSQVQYWEPLKWIARLRDYRTNSNPLLLDCNMDAGHGGGSGRTNERKEWAKEFSFILDLEGIEK